MSVQFNTASQYCCASFSIWQKCITESYDNFFNIKSDRISLIPDARLNRKPTRITADVSSTTNPYCRQIFFNRFDLIAPELKGSETYLISSFRIPIFRQKVA